MKIREMNGIMNQIAYYSEIAESSCENDEARKAIREFGNFLRANISCASMCDDENDGDTLAVMLDNGAKMPTRAHEQDAGADLYSREDVTVEARGSATIDTGVHIGIPEGYVGFLKSKSGLNVKHNITSEGVIDAGYTGSIVVKLYNNGGYDYAIKAGDKISQIVIMPIATPKFKEVKQLKYTERGTGGFGSTGR